MCILHWPYLLYVCRDRYDATPKDRLSEDEENYQEIAHLLDKYHQQHWNLDLQQVSVCCKYLQLCINDVFNRPVQTCAHDNKASKACFDYPLRFY